MRQVIEGFHRSDEHGNPAGGNTSGVGLAIQWQDGPLLIEGVRIEPNGAFVEGVIAAAIDRLEYYQSTKFASAYNARALEHLKAGLAQLEERTRDREQRQVEGTHQV